MSKSALLIGIGKLKPKKAEGEADKSVSPEDDALNEFMEAFEAGDKDTAREALRSAIKICAMDYAEE